MDYQDGIAIVGMACRLPGDVQDPASFWDLLMSQKLARGPFPSNRFNAAAFYHPQKGRPGNMRYTEGYCISNNLEHFDGGFFGMTASDILCLDPQQRQLLECCFECLESGGITLEDVAGSMTGVYVGNFASDYETLAFKEPERIEGMAVLGMGRTTVSNRVSYVYDLHGPSVTMDTACSSTLYALHFAVQALRNGEIPAAFVGGVNLILTLEYHFAIGQIGALSPTAQCHAFDASADGYSRGEAINVLYLKRAADAIRDGDPIRAVIRGSSLTANGKNNGITLPSALAQELSIRKAYEQSGPLDYSAVGYVECHGTGTPAGDPIETTAIGNVFGSHREWHDPLYIGSTKPQVGHGEACSAITSIMKVVLSMENGIIPGTIGVKKLNPALDLRGGALAVITKNTPWPEGKAKRASVNSSGYGGANGHVVIDSVDEYFKSIGIPNPYNKPPEVDLYDTILQKKFLLPVTGHDEYSMRKSLDSLMQVLQCQTYDFHELLYTMVARRTRFSHRAIIPVEIGSERDLTIREPITGRTNNSVPIVAFVFTGQGAQWAGMGRQLLDRYPSVRRTFKKLNLALSQLKQRPTWTLEEILLEPVETSKIGEVSFSQPICTAIQIAIVDLLREWKVQPAATIGHSSGELAAAYAAGLITAEDAIVAAYLRGVHAALTQAPGTMVAVALGATQAESFFAEHGISSADAVVACINSPESVTLSGKSEAMDTILKLLKQRSILCKKLSTGGKAYHSPSMKEVGSGYSEAIIEAMTRSSENFMALANGDHTKTKPVMISTVTLAHLQTGDINGSYWQRNLESPVLFDPALKLLLGLKFGLEERHVDCLVEIGPHSSLKGPIKQVIASPEVQDIWNASLGTAAKVTYEQTLERGNDAEDDMMRLATSLFIKGYPLDLLHVNGHTAYRPNVVIDLPMYPWNHETTHPLLVNRATKDYKFASHPRHDLIGSRLPGGNRMEPIWRNYLRLEDVPWIKDHVIGSAIIVPGAAYLAMAIEAD